ncbi:2-amino-4-hydroxy-6-hydroxymethyldihydropteridine diphosphokinase [Alistipes sp. OttesenSCG-928-B03]|nr:2-amino-4-hydroxy-6-hydroxymethyldihydropteridine diphosphokinase [Alistipes sp. OttesenSCG-928-B03]
MRKDNRIVMARAVLITGANAGDAAAAMAAAREMIAGRVGAITAHSRVMESAPWGDVSAVVYGSEGAESTQVFLNQVLVVETELEPHELLQTTQQIEAELGRRRPEAPREGGNDGTAGTGVANKGGAEENGGDFGKDAAATQEETAGRTYFSRTMDIDILFYGDLVIDTPQLTIPHPLIARRGFVLRPLADALPGYVHPALGRTAGEMLEELERTEDNE